MLFKSFTFLTGLLICSQLFAAPDIIWHLEGTNYDSKQAINSTLEIKLIKWSDENEQETVLGHYNEYLQNQDSADFVDEIATQSIKGYLLTSETTGYIIRYAWSEKIEEGERLVLMITPGLKSIMPNIWQEPNPNPKIHRDANPDYKGFTLVEVITNSEGGLVKTSLDTGIMVREDNKLLLANFQDTRTFAELH